MFSTERQGRWPVFRSAARQRGLRSSSLGWRVGRPAFREHCDIRRRFVHPLNVLRQYTSLNAEVLVFELHWCLAKKNTRQGNDNDDKDTFSRIHAGRCRLHGNPDRRTRIRGGAGKLRYGPLLRRRLDRYHSNHRDRDDHPRSARLRDGREGSVGARYLHLAEEQGHRRLSRQLDADHGSGHRPPIAKTSPSRRYARTSQVRNTRLRQMPRARSSASRTSRISPRTRRSSTARSTGSSRAMTATA